MAGKVEVGAPVSLDWVAVRLDCWCICLCYVHFTPENPEDGKMYLLVLAHSGCPGQGPGSHKMVVVVVVVVVVAVVVRYKFEPWIIYYGILSVQFTCLTVFFHNLSKFSLVYLGLAPSTSYSIHLFTLSLSSFCITCPYHRNLFCCSTEIMSSNPSVSLNPLLNTTH